MNMPLCAALLSWVVVPALLTGQTQNSTADYSCTKSLELPTKGLFAAGAKTSGTIEAVVRISKDGLVDQLHLTGRDPDLQAEVRAVMSLSKFDSRCVGQSLKFVFAFTVEDPATDNIIPPRVQFMPPNRFQLTFRRVKPNFD